MKIISGDKRLRKDEDAPLVKLAKEGDFDAFEQLVHKFESRIYNHCLKILNSQEDAEDVLQETFLQVHRFLGSFRGDSSFSTWLFKIATNGCLMRIRKRKQVNLVSIDKPIEFNGSSLKKEVVDWSQNPYRLSSNDEIKKALDQFMAMLPEDKRVVLVLKDVEGFSNIEISHILGMSVAAVKSRLHRARLFMRDELSKYFDGGLEIARLGRPSNGL
ncbi:RNA polymerase sigma factor RpoE [hydrothermal vent metagenome]|uniref:RNA polymerase sigma factor RpoE n=1 Tax=hydrothermal vent metagenome TaxID=652676 RepID=A0A3B1CNL4_9ZZZZ